MERRREGDGASKCAARLPIAYDALSQKHLLVTLSPAKTPAHCHHRPAHRPSTLMRWQAV
jgi:hypothetical protein